MFPFVVARWYQAALYSVGALAGGLLLLIVFYAMGERLTVLVDIERNTRSTSARPGGGEGKRYWALPLLAFLLDLMGLLSLLAAFGAVALVWLRYTGVIGGPVGPPAPVPGL